MPQEPGLGSINTGHIIHDQQPNMPTDITLPYSVAFATTDTLGNTVNVTAVYTQTPTN